MSKTTKNARKSIGGARLRLGVIATGLGASMVLGAGSALAASSERGDVFASGTAAQLAQSARAQADQQHKAAVAKEKAEDRADAGKTSRNAERKGAGANKAAKKAAAAKAAKKKARAWTKPVSGEYELSAGYGNSGGRWANKHSGQDFAVPSGTTVKAVHGGKVVKAGPNGAGDGPAYGNAVVIKHSDNTYSQYAHLSSVKVKPGQHVKTGQPIGKSGSTGNSSGPHLHFEIRTTADYGTGKNPLPTMRAHGVIV
jgi:murein DD-endopeptidase MepM/ murein hydrolase activator NlpD